MSREDEIFREALELDISASDEINNRILRTVERKKNNGGFLRTAVIVAACCIALFETGMIVNAAANGRIVEYLRGKLDNITYVFGNGSNTELDIVQNNGEEWEQVIYLEDNVVMSHPVSEDETVYSLYLKVTDKNGKETFISLTAAVKEGETTEDLYYAIRGDFYGMLSKFRNPDEKEQILTALKEAAENTDSTAVRDALLDLSSDYENNRRTFYNDLPGDLWEKEGRIVFFEDVSDLPSGKTAIIVNPVNDKDMSWIFVLRIDDNELSVNRHSGEMYSEEYHQELLENKTPVYDLRDN